MNKHAVIGVSEIVLSVANLAQMREFYIEVLGFHLHSQLSMESETEDPLGEPTICFLKICDVDTPLGTDRHPQMLVLIDYRRHVFARPRFQGHEVSTSTLNHLAFEIPPDSFSFHAQRLETLDIRTTFSEFPKLNAQAIFFKDPEGNVLELICQSSKKTSE